MQQRTFYSLFLILVVVGCALGNAKKNRDINDVDNINFEPRDLAGSYDGEILTIPTDSIPILDSVKAPRRKNADDDEIFVPIKQNFPVTSSP
uniref:Secreted protein n=1 Tax=Panagrellus redivivus TaxID=6233 RepID=A0A7E4W2V9_PANRE